jgi:NADPH:quinone reductase-like Zn-dependent oxidoreductase
LAEYVVLNQAGVVVLPAHLTYVEGATLPCAAVTAWQAVVERGRLTMGETVLLLGTGGVSIFALQFAKRLGARVIIISSSDAKLAKALAMGADLTINYHQVPDWEQRVWELTGGEGVDQVIEVGGAGTLEKSLRAVRVGGRISLIGVLAGAGEVNHAHILRKSIDVQGIYVGSREMFENMNRAIALHQLRPVVDRVFDFADVPDAYQYLQSGAHFGKVTVSLG